MLFQHRSLPALLIFRLLPRVLKVDLSVGVSQISLGFVAGEVQPARSGAVGSHSGEECPPDPIQGNAFAISGADLIHHSPVRVLPDIFSLGVAGGIVGRAPMLTSAL